MAFQNQHLKLKQGEQVLWQGKPKHGIIFRSKDWTAIPFSIFWGWCAIVLTISTMRSENIGLNILYIMPFLALSIYITFGRFLGDAKFRSRAIYTLTNKNIIISYGKDFKDQWIVSRNSVRKIIIKTKANDFGTIEFKIRPGHVNRFFEWPLNWPFGKKFQRPTFDYIQNAEHVYELIKQTRN